MGLGLPTSKFVASGQEQVCSRIFHPEKKFAREQKRAVANEDKLRGGRSAKSNPFGRAGVRKNRDARIAGLTVIDPDGHSYR